MSEDVLRDNFDVDRVCHYGLVTSTGRIHWLLPFGPVFTVLGSLPRTTLYN